MAGGIAVSILTNRPGWGALKRSRISFWFSPMTSATAT
jgi:hypothetical protein